MSAKAKRMRRGGRTNGIKAMNNSKSLTRNADRKLLFESYEQSKLLGRVVSQLLEKVQGYPDKPRKKLFASIPRIEGQHVILDRVVDKDADALRDLIDNPSVQRCLPTYLFEKQRDDVHETIRLLYGDVFTNQESLILAVRLK